MSNVSSLSLCFDFVPKGQAKVTRQFIAGFVTVNAARPARTLERFVADRGNKSISSVPLGRAFLLIDNPAMSCRAIFKRPAGTTEAISRKRSSAPWRGI